MQVALSSEGAKGPNRAEKGREAIFRRPEGAPLADKAFTDANDNGIINIRMYEAGIGDGYRVQTNVRLEGALAGAAFRLEPVGRPQPVKAR